MHVSAGGRKRSVSEPIDAVSRRRGRASDARWPRVREPARKRVHGRNFPLLSSFTPVTSAIPSSTRGVSLLKSRKLRVGLVGVGNCASSFVQGLSYYRRARSNEPAPGLMNATLGGYHVSDIEISAAFDVNAAKVGRDVAEAILAPPNNTQRFAQVTALGVPVERGETLDGLGKYLREEIEESDKPPVDVAASLVRSRTDVLVSYLPVGSQRATEWYAERALQAGCAFVNCIPVFIASRPEWRARFEARRLPLIGDDIKSQVGATIVHRVLANLFQERGVRLDRTYQLNFGGNTDFQNMLERERLESKKISKTRAVTSMLEEELAP